MAEAASTRCIDMLNGVPIYFEIHGSGEPVLLLHGFSGCNQDWSQVTTDWVSAFQKKARAIIMNAKSGQNIQAQLEYGDHLINKNPGKYLNPSGFYIHLVEENTPLPAGFETVAQRKAREDAERRLDEAIQEYREAIRLEPNLPESHYNLGNALARIPGREQEAIAEYSISLRLKPDLEPAARAIDRVRNSQSH